MRHKLGASDGSEPTFRTAPLMIDVAAPDEPSPPLAPHLDVGGGSPESSVSEDESEAGQSPARTSGAKRPSYRPQSSTSWPLVDRPMRRTSSSSSKVPSSSVHLDRLIDTNLSSSAAATAEVHPLSGGGGGEGQPMRVTFTHATGDAIEGWGKTQVEGS